MSATDGRAAHSDAFYLKHLPAAVRIEGVTVEVIAKKLGITPSGLRKVLTRLNIPTPTQAVIADRNAAASAAAARIPRDPSGAATYITNASSGKPRQRDNSIARVWESRRPALLAAIAAGLEMEYICLCYNTAQYNVQHWLRQFGIPPTRPRTPESKREYARLRKMYVEHPELFAPLPKPGDHLLVPLPRLVDPSKRHEST